MLTLTTKVVGLRELLADFATFEKRGKKLFKRTRLAQRLRADFFIMNRKTFTTRANGTWPRLSERYRLYKERVRPGRGVLIFDGDLIRSLTKGGDPNAIFKVERSGKALTLGTKDSKAAWHQNGTKRMPRRRIIKMDRRAGNRWGKFGLASLTAGLFGS